MLSLMVSISFPLIGHLAETSSRREMATSSPPPSGRGRATPFLAHFLPSNALLLVGSHPFVDANETRLREETEL